ncbi:MAG: hypothetical protein R3F17_15585 [Planctomycetota bacterium]
MQRAEEALQSFLAGKLGSRHRYLEEHRILGLPDRARAEAILTEAGAQVGVIGHGELNRWLLTMCLELYMEHDPLLQPLAREFYSFYNQHVYPHDHGAEVYRHVILASLGGAPLPTVDSVLAAPALPAQTEAVLQAFARRILELDAQAEVWRPEIERIRGVVRDLEKDLAEHKASLATSEKDLAEHKASLATAEKDLAEHRDSLNTCSSDLEQHRTSLWVALQDLEEHRKVVSELTRLRAEEREAFQELERSLREELADTSSTDELEHRLSRKAQHIQHMEAELDRVNQLASGLNEQLVQAHEQYQAQLREAARQQVETERRLSISQDHGAQLETRLAGATAVLASRWQILKRLFGPKLRP